ncbi:MAG TPA: trehalose-6-phosphate synthase, partial [Burkholderiales bacterium]|nr:trehalose-6-phosphate synthase [Burkholderiales bacterium]
MIGGLAAALLPAVKQSGVVWFGSSGRTREIASGATPLVQIQSYGRGSIATVDAPEQHYAGFYEGYSNSALWPLLHSRLDLCRARPQDYISYRAMNLYMARMLTTFGGLDSSVWVHDYHFLPLAAELRKLGVTRSIGFFLHTPWPRPQVFGTLPQRRDLLEAMLAYDLIGFQTDADRTNFAELVRQELHLPSSGSVIRSRFGICRIATFPIGIDVQEFADRAQHASTDPEVQRLCASLNGAKLLLGVDRIDYSKGLHERIRALDCLLTQYPKLRRRVSMLQVAVPSRTSIDSYRVLQREIAALTGEVNAKHGDVDWAPIRYVTKSFCQSTLAGFYRASAVGVVTPLRDGMNLVAKEYVAAQDPADPGVLVLSRSAGAARELDAALQVDANDVDAIAFQVAAALSMPLDERRARWHEMMEVLLRGSIHAWFSDFMQM